MATKNKKQNKAAQESLTQEIQNPVVTDTPNQSTGYVPQQNNSGLKDENDTYAPMTQIRDGGLWIDLKLGKGTNKKLTFADVVEKQFPGADPNKLTDEQKDAITETIIHNPGYEPGEVTKSILGDDRIAKIDESRNKPEGQQNTEQNVEPNVAPTYNGMGDIKDTVEDLEGKKADPNAPYAGIPVMNNDGTTNGYRSIFTDIKDIGYADDKVEEARKNDPTRVAAETNKNKLEGLLKKQELYNSELDNLTKKLQKDNTREGKVITNAAIKKYKELADQNAKEIEALKGDIKAEDDRAYMEAFSEDQRMKFAELNNEKYKLDRSLNYMMNDLQGDIDLYLDPNADAAKKQEAIARLQEYVPELQDNLKNRLNIASGEIANIAETVKATGNQDFIEALDNINAAIEMFNKEGLNINDPETAKQLGAFVDRLDDIVKHQDKYDLDTRYANDMKESAVNRLLFDIFDDVKSAFVFMAAIESGNPQLIRSSIDTYNNKIQQAEADYKVGQIKGIEENKVRDITGENIANFFTTSEAKPQLEFLAKQLNITEGEAQKRAIEASEKAYEEYNKYLNQMKNEGKKPEAFAAWVLQQRASNVNSASGLLGLLLGAGLMNTEQIENLIKNNLSKATEGFENGGIVGGEGVGATAGSDNTTINAREGEMVLNADQQKQLWDLVNGKGKSGKWIDNALGKVKEKQEAETPKEDPALTLDMQNTVNQALAARTQPQQKPTMQGQSLNVNKGFGKTQA